MLSSRDRLLQQCTVKLVPADSKDWGTGFLVTPNCILTCAHVVDGYDVIPVWWRGQAWATARVEQLLPMPVDLALLQIEPPEGEQPPWVLLSEIFKPFDRLYVYGYPDDFPDGGSVTIQCEGDAQEQGVTLIKAQRGQVRPGHSGSPALNWETGQVCGVVSDTRNRSTDLGGLLIPVSTVFSHFPDIQAQNQAAHTRDSLWFTLPLQALVASHPRSPVPPPQFSTYNPATFAGRSAETVTLTACLRGSCRILAIVGMTGIGKTALAERVVANIMDATEAVTLPYCRFSLDDLSLTPDFASSGAALLRELGEEPTLADQKDSANLMEHILQRLNRQPCCLQFDSLERLLRGNEQEGWSEFCDPLWLDLLQKFLAGTDCPSKLLLTSQDIPGDLDTIASHYPQFWHCEPLQGLNPDEQRTLFQNLGLTPTDGDRELLERIGAFYDGHPLVLQVIAEEIRQRPFQNNIRQYWQHYGAEFTTTASVTATKLDRSRLFRRRVRQRVEQTIQRLPVPARQMLCASAVFRRPVPVEFWCAMLSNGNADAAFDILHDRHLVEYAPTTSSDEQSQTTPPLLICQHNLIRSVAYTLLKADSPTWEAAERQAAYLWLNNYEPPSYGHNLEKVRGYLEAFDHYYKVGDREKVASIPYSEIGTGITLEQQLSIWGYKKELLPIYQVLLQIFQEINDRCGMAKALNCLAIPFIVFGKYEQAIKHLEQALSISQEVDAQKLFPKESSKEKCRALINLGVTYRIWGKYDQAIGYYLQGLATSKEIGDQHGEAVALGGLGITCEELGQYQQAIEHHTKSLEIARDANFRKKFPQQSRLGESNALNNMGVAYNKLGEYEKALESYDKCLEITQDMGDLRGEANALGNLGATQIKRGNYQDAKIKIHLALRTFQELGMRRSECEALKDLAELHQALDEIEVAQQYCQQALTLAEELGIPLKSDCEELLQQLETSEEDNEI